MDHTHHHTNFNHTQEQQKRYLITQMILAQYLTIECSSSTHPIIFKVCSYCLTLFLFDRETWKYQPIFSTNLVKNHRTYVINTYGQWISKLRIIQTKKNTNSFDTNTHTRLNNKISDLTKNTLYVSNKLIRKKTQKYSIQLN